MTQTQKAGANGIRIKTCLVLWLQHGTNEALDAPALTQRLKVEVKQAQSSTRSSNPDYGQEPQAPSRAGSQQLPRPSFQMRTQTRRQAICLNKCPETQ